MRTAVLVAGVFLSFSGGALAASIHDGRALGAVVFVTAGTSLILLARGLRP